MPLLRKEVVLLDESITIGEFDPSVPGAYRNVKTFPLEVKQGRELFVSVDSDNPVDVALSDSGGICIKFAECIRNDTVGPVETSKRETIALILGVFRGDKAELRVRAWMG